MSIVNFNNTTPAAPGGNTNITWQQSGDNVSGYVPSSGGGGSGGLVLLGSYPAASTIEIDAVTRNASGQSAAIFQSDFDLYQIELVGIVLSGSDYLGFQFSSNGGSSYDSGANYAFQLGYLDGTSPGLNDGNPTTAATLFFTNVAATANLSWQASIKLTLPLSTSLYKQLAGDVNSPGGSNTGIHSNYAWAAIWRSTAAANAFRLTTINGANIAAGNMYVYGLSK